MGGGSRYNERKTATSIMDTETMAKQPGSSGSVLIVDDNERLFNSLAINLQKQGYASEWAGNGTVAVEKFTAMPFAAALLDLALGDEDGLSILPDLLRIRPRTPVIIITGYGTLEKAVKAIKLGAHDFLQKPVDIDRLLELLRDASNAPQSADRHDLPSMVAESPAMRELREKALLVAASDLPVLITGESGTGKELAAKFVHANSPRRDKTFLGVNCSAIADTLADSELFGHAKGAFTGATADRRGFFEQADGGTLHMDEIGDMAVTTQAKILRVLEESLVRRVGENSDRPVDVRFIASTNKDLEAGIRAGGFRQDLYYRLNAATIHLPPLRDRREDIPPLLERFLADLAEDGAGKRFSSKALEALVDYDWPGNIRELRNMVKICTLLAPGRIIELRDLPQQFTAAGCTRSVRLVDNEREIIKKALLETGGNKQLAAQRLGISRRSLYNKLERYGIV